MTLKESILGKVLENKIDDMIEDLFDVMIGDHGDKAEEIANKWIDDNYINSPEYEPDEPNTYYLEVMDDDQVKELYNLVKKYIK